MPSAVWRPQAEADLDEIGSHIARDNLDAALRLIDKIEDACNAYAQFPDIGTPRDYLMPGLRSFSVGKYI